MNDRKSTRFWRRRKLSVQFGQFYTVWFNAWHFDQDETLWASFILEALEQIRLQAGWRSIKIALKLNLSRFGWKDFFMDVGRSMSVILLLGLIGISVLGMAAIIFDLSLFEIMDSWVHQNLKVIAALGLASVSYAIFKDTLGMLVSPFNLGITKYLQDAYYKNKRGYGPLTRIQEDFNKLVSAMAEKGKWPVVLFIDDLDRCTPYTIAKVLESINVLMNSKYCIFIVGMDSDVLAASIQAKYKDLHEFYPNLDNPSGLGLGRKFLEKIIQIDFHIPIAEADSVSNFINHNLGASPPTIEPAQQVVQSLIQAEQRSGKSLAQAREVVEQALPDLKGEVAAAFQDIQARSFDDNPKVQKTIRDAVPFLDYNPRKIKRFINLLRLQCYIALRRGLLDSFIRTEILGKWILVQLNWPEFFQIALEQPRFVNDFLKVATRLNKAKTATERKSILDDISSFSSTQERIKRLYNSQKLIDLLASIPHSPSQVEQYLRQVQISSPPLKEKK